ncbi:PREDICTED: dimethyladenosine transferase 2, mitochondrial [Nicrophorus vespilloides]|uniref:rRNA adenine N(6)-methyltransferase n=1 Tax=Nicrophorus vespilloides TaxID=110193 RepID=A0ABM1MMQ5_NICVS|nr:PREDICTED: dimethyladenosine transferase 2, mitochondrial [Nicrophorus vespilloides]
MLQKSRLHSIFIRGYCDYKKSYMTRNLKMKHGLKISKYFESMPHLKEIKEFIPKKYLLQKRQYSAENLYLIDSKIAKSIVRHVIPAICNGPQTICETGAGLGLITSELLDCKIPCVRLYEPCQDFRITLRDFNRVYPGRVELFVKDIFQLTRLSGMDKLDRSNRVDQLLKGVPIKEWKHGPAMTIIGTMTSISFITYLMKMLALQSEINTHGRIQLFTIMRPGDYVKLSAGPSNNLHTYQSWSVLFDLFFDHELLEKYPRTAFLPWEMKAKITNKTRVIKKVDLEYMYFVKINFKKELPTDNHLLLPLHYFVRQFFGRGKNKIIPTLEKWIPGVGLNLLIPKLVHSHYYNNLTIFTEFGDLTPQEILGLFKEMINHEGYQGSSFAAMVESELLKSETRETSINDDIPFNKDLIDDLEEKIDN